MANNWIVAKYCLKIDLVLHPACGGGFGEIHVGFDKHRYQIC